MDHPGSGFVASPWAAVLGHHAMAATAASADAGFAAAAAAHVQNVAAVAQHHHHHPHHHPIAAAAHHHSHHHPHHHAHSHHSHHTHHSHHLNPTTMPMDLHVPQGFPYYRYRDDALCWGDRKSMEEIGAAQSSVNARILELRKEKSRDAARSRRGKENYEFYELAKMLPLPAAITSQLDKASIIRLTISYLKLRDFSGQGDPPWTREPSSSSKLKSAAIRRSPAVDLFEQHQGTHILQSLDGFALAVAADGRFLYISETVSIYLGLSQVEMTGSSIFDYVHQSDHAEIADQLGLSLTNGGISAGGNGNGTTGLGSPTSGASDDGVGTHGTNNPDVSAQMTVSSTSGYKGYERSFCIRMKSTLTKRGCHFKSSGYRVVLLLCKLRPQYTFSHTRKSQPPLLGMVALAIALPPPSVHEIRLECDMFVTRINFDFRIAHCEPRVSDLLDYNPEDLVNKSMYSLCHAEDATRLRKSHMDLIEKGQVLTGYFRLMNKNGGYTWLQTCATVVCSTKNADEQNIICVNYVISNRENENLILDCCQMEPTVDCIKHEELVSDKNSGSPSSDAAPEGPAGVGGHTKDSSPKAEGDGHNQRSRGRGSSSTVNSNTSNLTLVKDNPNSVSVEMENVVSSLPTTVTAPAATPTTTTKRKRKTKVSMQIEENSDVNTSNVSDTDTQPQTKIPTIEREVPRSRLPSTIEQIPQQQQQQQTHIAQQQIQQSQQTHTEASVKDLENAMTKHLPSPGINGSDAAVIATDFSTDALLKQQQQNEKSSTIQWIGAPHYQQPAQMPATALLRQLYANRESVIRATARQTPTGVFYGDQQGGPLPTPPGSESSYDNHQYLQLHPAHPQKSSSDAFTNLVSTYGGYHTSIDYHNAMTPPSSVSPRDSNNTINATKASSHNSNGYDYTDSLRVQYTAPNNAGESGSTPALPLKPQPYSAATATMHHPHPSADASSITYSNLDQSQYFPPHSSFHLYHKGTPPSGWYSTPS
ncbi:protein trachealess isoform X2 [Zeugodacus cucurbitae]|uniref:protein trachealess isoform X2 n=1 Tax=Zeugodacus cucurbitae TaxID=28588 RepID=UPI0005968A4C|nr:protein trachealess isoform X2 [Zeugodacus cucurbitae]